MYTIYPVGIVKDNYVRLYKNLLGADEEAKRICEQYPADVEVSKLIRTRRYTMVCENEE